MGGQTRKETFICHLTLTRDNQIKRRRLELVTVTEDAKLVATIIKGHD
jgi:hypothetical protein